MYTINDQKLAQKLLSHSLDLKENERIMIQLIGMGGISLARALTDEIRKRNARPFLELQDTEIQRTLLEQGDEDYWKDQAATDKLPLMKQMDAYIGIRASENVYESSDVSGPAFKAYSDEFLKPVHFNERVKNTRWCVLRYPSAAFAMNARMPTNRFTEFYYNACLLDYDKLRKAMIPLEERLRKGKEIRLKGDGTDISFSIEGQEWVSCFGERNIPDGELFSSPLIDSVNGHITYAPSVYQGRPFERVKLYAKDGVVTDFESSNPEALEIILNTDEGARRFGEFSFGTNPVIKEPMYDILFDEKIYGSNHLTLGQDYDIAPNGNKSSIHWDLVCIGADVYLDGELIRRGREFVPDDLQVLNPNHLLSQ